MTGEDEGRGTGQVVRERQRARQGDTERQKRDREAG